MLIVLRGGSFGGQLIEDDYPVDVLIVNDKHFYRKTERGELVDVSKGRQATATVYEIDYRLGQQQIQWEFPGLNTTQA